MAVDGNYTSYWSADSATTPQWIQFDFAEPTALSRLVFWEREIYDPRFQMWRLQAWLENDWVDIASAVRPQHSISFPRVQSDKFRLIIDQASGPPVLKEVQLLDEFPESDPMTNSPDSIFLLPQASPGQSDEPIFCSISSEPERAAIHITCKGQPFRKYSLYRKPDLADDDWGFQAELQAASDGTVDFVEEPSSTSSIYRVSRE